MRKGGDARAERVWDELHKRESRREIKKRGGRSRKRGRDRKGHDVCRNAVSVSILRTNVAFGH